MHTHWLDRLVLVCAQLLDAATDSGEIHCDLEAYQLMRGGGSLCGGADRDSRYDARQLVEVLSADCPPPR